jgi:hypothetical protein
LKENLLDTLWAVDYLRILFGVLPEEEKQEQLED